MLDARKHIPIVEKKIYFDNAGAGPLTVDVYERVKWFLDLWRREGEPWGEVLEDIVNARREFAELVKTREDYVAVVPGVTYGLNAVFASLKIKPRSNVVVSSFNFPTSFHTLHAMRRRGVIKEVRVVNEHNGSTRVEDYEKLVDDNTVAVVVDYVGWLSGYREDLRAVAEIARSHGAILVSDAFHAVGVLGVDVEKLGVDVLLTGGYKWLMGLHGAGFVYVEKNLLQELEPMFAGWMAIEDSVIERMLRGEKLFERPFDTNDYKKPSKASMLEWGTWAAIAVEGTLEAIRFIKKHRAVELYSTHTRKLVEKLMDELEDTGYTLYTPRDSFAAIVSFKARDSYRIASLLGREGIVVSARPGLVRVSPHFYSVVEEVEKFIEVVRRIHSIA